MQVDPIKPTLKTPGTKRLKLEYGGLLSSVAFRFNVRRYKLVAGGSKHYMSFAHENYGVGTPAKKKGK